MSDDAIPAPASLGPGDKVADYRLEEQIGQGGMAVVYRGRAERPNHRCPAQPEVAKSGLRLRVILRSSDLPCESLLGLGAGRQRHRAALRELERECLAPVRNQSW